MPAPDRYPACSPDDRMMSWRADARIWAGFSPAIRLAHLLRIAWQRLVRPVTLGTRMIVLRQPDTSTTENAPGAAPAVLLVQHSYVPGWHLPGGGVHRREPLPAAAIREVAEETGLTITGPVRLLGIYARFCHGASDHVATYCTEHWQGTLHADGLEIRAAAFFPLDAMPEGTTPATRRRIAEYRGLTEIAELW